MDNYFVSYTGRRKTKSYIIPEISVISNTTSRDNIIEHKDDNDNPTEIDAFRATEKFNPYTIRVSHPMDMDAFVVGAFDQYYEVFEGIYCVEDGTLKLKVKKQYGK